VPRTFASVFSEPDDFQASLRDEGVVGFLVTGRGQFRARLTQIALHRLRLAAGEEELSRVVFVTVPADMVLVSLPIGGRPSPVWGGIELRTGEMMTLGPGERVYARTGGACGWGAIQVPAEDLVQYGRALSGAGFVVPPAARWRPPAITGRNVRSLHRAAIRMAEARPGALIDIEAAHGLEQQLIHALIECLSAGSADEGTPATRRHQDVVVRFEGLLQAQPERNPRMAEICAALGVSERLLRSLCAEHLGMSPTSYLRLRRMSLVHRTLWRGDPAAETVSEVVRRYGFRDLGRFAANYRALFGELPSATLRRSLHPGTAHLVVRRRRGST
jgi:AraC-like DNA-binding protein